MNNLIHCDMCGYLMTKRWSETIDGKTYCRDCVPKKRLIDLGEPTEFDDKATEGADVKIERRCGMVTGASCGHVTLSWIPGDGRNGTRSWVLATHDGGSIRRIRLSWNELGDLAAILQSITNKEKEMGGGR